MAESQTVTEQLRLADQRWIHVEQQLDFLLHGTLAHEEQTVSNCLLQIEGNSLQLQSAGFDLREIKNVVDNPEQRLSGIVDLADIVTLTRIKPSL